MVCFRSAKLDTLDWRREGEIPEHLRIPVLSSLEVEPGGLVWAVANWIITGGKAPF